MEIALPRMSNSAGLGEVNFYHKHPGSVDASGQRTHVKKHQFMPFPHPTFCGPADL